MTNYPTATMIDPNTFLLTWHYPTPAEIKKLPVHGNTNWRSSSGIIKQWKNTARVITICTATGEQWQEAIVYYRFYKPSKQWRLDYVNAMQRMKSVIDGIVLGGLIPDDTDKYLQVGQPQSFTKSDNPRIEIEIQRLDV